MSRLLYTVTNLVDEIRAQLDEANADSVSTESDILPTLNRAQDYAFDILARKYPEPILKYTSLPLIGDQAEYRIPEEVFEDRILKLEVSVPTSTGGTTYREIERISYRDLSLYESASKTNVPYYHAIYARNIRFIPTPTGTYSARMWFLRNPEKLVEPQGRITVINPTSNYVIVDSAGPSLVTESDQLGSYVNWVDGQTGEIKGTLQIQSVQENKITFRTTPVRNTVLNRTINGSISSLTTTTITPELDDYLCAIDGICVPYFGRPTSNFLIEYTVSEITRKLGGAADMEEKVLDKFEKQLERTWVGREQTLRIKKRSQNWGIPTRRLWTE